MCLSCLLAYSHASCLVWDCALSCLPVHVMPVQIWRFRLNKFALAELCFNVAGIECHSIAGLITWLHPHLTRTSLTVCHHDEHFTDWQLHLHTTQAQQLAGQSLTHMCHAGKAKKAQPAANGGPGQMKAKGGKGQPKQKAGKAGDALKSGFRQRAGQKGQQQGRTQKQQFSKQARGQRTSGKP